MANFYLSIGLPIHFSDVDSTYEVAIDFGLSIDVAAAGILFEEYADILLWQIWSSC